MNSWFLNTFIYVKHVSLEHFSSLFFIILGEKKNKREHLCSPKFQPVRVEGTSPVCGLSAPKPQLSSRLSSLRFTVEFVSSSGRHSCQQEPPWHQGCRLNASTLMGCQLLCLLLGNLCLPHSTSSGFYFHFILKSTGWQNHLGKIVAIFHVYCFYHCMRWP